MTQVAAQQPSLELEKNHLKVQTNTKVEKVQSLADWITDSHWMCIVESSTFDFPSFPEKNEVFEVFYVTIENNEISNLFRTLLSLGGFIGKTIEYQKEKETFVIRLYQSQESLLLSKLIWVQTYIEKELRFKKVISRLIENEKRYHAEEKLLRRELF